MIQNHTFRSMLCKELSEQAAGCLLCEYMQDVVMLTEDSSLRSLRTYLEGSIVHRNVAIGVSMPLQHPEEIPVAYEQAVFAVEAADYPAMRWCRELALPYLLQSLRKKEMALKLLHPALLFLEDYDRENQTDFLETLKVFLTTRCSQKETADRLHIHLNTLKYRLHRISDLCRTDFKDPEELFYMELSIYLKGV